VLLVNIAAILLIFLIGRKLYDSMAASAAAVAYAVLSFSPTTLGFAGHATHFVVLAALLAVFCLQGAIHWQAPWRFFLAGVFAGLAPVMKQPGIVFTAFVLV
jgi:4-amino-4-deoxy-L-arabinose transferase-like glycosyltransferase